MADSTSTNRHDGGKPTRRVSTPNTAARKKNGSVILRINNPPIRNGSNTVVRRYTDATEKLATLAMLPVPKYATLMKNRKK